MKRVLSVAAACVLFATCTSVYRAYPGPERPTREVGWIMVNGFTVLEIDSTVVGGIRPNAIHLLPGEHSLVAAGAWDLPHGVFQTGGPLLKREVTNRLYFSIAAGHVYQMRWTETGTQQVGFHEEVVTGMRIYLAELDKACCAEHEVSRYER